MVSLFFNTNYSFSTSVEELDNNNKQFYEHVNKNLLLTYEEEKYLPIPVYPLLTPTIISQLINHIMLSLGRYATYLDMPLNVSIR